MIVSSSVVSNARLAPPRMVARERRRQARHLGEALEHNQLRLTRAPRVRLLDGGHVADEVTLHWPRAALSASAALSVSGRDVETQRTGQWMLDAAAATGAEHRRIVSVSVTRFLLDDTLPGMVETALAQAGLAPPRLELRLSEAAVLNPSSALVLMLGGLRSRGVRLAVDDWGMRHGSTTLLRQVGLDAIYLDPSLTHDLTPGAPETAVMAAVLVMAHALRLRVIARAVNTPGRLEALRRLGVDEGLGQMLAPRD